MTVKSFWKKNGIDVKGLLWRRELPKNVYKRKTGNGYYVTIGSPRNNTQKYIGSYQTLTEAINARDNARALNSIK
jgi:hypothetical protein